MLNPIPSKVLILLRRPLGSVRLLRLDGREGAADDADDADDADADRLLHRPRPHHHPGIHCDHTTHFNST